MEEALLYPEEWLLSKNPIFLTRRRETGILVKLAGVCRRRRDIHREVLQSNQTTNFLLLKELKRLWNVVVADAKRKRWREIWTDLTVTEDVKSLWKSI